MKSMLNKLLFLTSNVEICRTGTSFYNHRKTTISISMTYGMAVLGREFIFEYAYATTM